MGTTRFGIIGYGKMGKIREATILARGDTEVVATADPYGPAGPYPHVSDWREMLQRDDLDAVMVCATNDIIPPVIIEALQRGLHVFSEKPPGRSMADIEAIRAAEAAAAGQVLKFGFNHRYHGSVLAAQRVFESGELGDLLTLRGMYGKAGGTEYEKNWRNDHAKSGGGILIDQGVHMIDLMHIFCGPFAEIKSMVADRYWTGLGVEDNVFALMRNEAGVMAQLHSSATQWQQTFRLELGFEKGHMALEGILSNSMGYAPELLHIGRLQYDDKGYPQPAPKVETLDFKADESWKLELDEFMDAVHGTKQITIGTSAHAWDAMNAVQRIYAGDPSFEFGPNTKA